MLAPDSLAADYVFPTEAGFRANDRPRPAMVMDRYLESSDKTWFLEREGKDPAGTGPKPRKLGWKLGVLVPCLLNIWGGIMFLRLGWVVGQAGIWAGLATLCLSYTVTTITTLSLSAIATNGEVKGGGIYFLIARALGPNYGTMIGLLFYFAQAFASAMYAVGVAEVIVELASGYGKHFFTGNQLNDVRVVGIAVMLLLLSISFLGMACFARTQSLLFVTMIIAIIAVYIGSNFPNFPTHDENYNLGFDGYGAWRNDMPAYQYDPTRPSQTYDFFTVFAVFFPAATGIMAGANVSGDLENPSTAIPKGTLLAVLITFVTYASLMFVLALSCARCIDVGGGACPPNGTLATQDWAYEAQRNMSIPMGGLLYNKIIMASLVPLHFFFFIGVFASSLSSALSSLVSAPRILQSVAKDRVLKAKWLTFLAVGRGENNEPVRALIFSSVIALCVVLIGNLDAIATLITNIFLMSYALVNFACFGASRTKTAGWRPSFRYYNKWVSLLGFVLCICVMFLIDWSMSLVTVVLCVCVYYLVDVIEPDVSWGAADEAQKYQRAIKAVSNLGKISKESVKTLRAQILVLQSGHETNSPALLKFATMFRYTQGMTILFDVVKAAPREQGEIALNRAPVEFSLDDDFESPKPQEKKSPEVVVSSESREYKNSQRDSRPFDVADDAFDVDPEEQPQHEEAKKPSHEVPHSIRFDDSDDEEGRSSSDHHYPHASSSDEAVDSPVKTKVVVPSPRSDSKPAPRNLLPTVVLPATFIGKNVDEVRNRRAAHEAVFNNRQLWGGRCPGAFAVVTSESSIAEAFRISFPAIGLGSMRPNTVLIGFPARYASRAPSDEFLLDYEQLLRNVMVSQAGCLMILRDDENLLDIDMNKTIRSFKDLGRWIKSKIFRTGGVSKKKSKKRVMPAITGDESEHELGRVAEAHVAAQLPTHLELKVPGSTIDVWFLADDGGFSILLPHILSLGPEFRGKKIRVFAVHDITNQSKTLAAQTETAEKAATPVAADNGLLLAEAKMRNTLFRLRIKAEAIAVACPIERFQLSEQGQAAYAACNVGVPMHELNAVERLQTVRAVNLGEVIRSRSGAKRSDTSSEPPAIVFITAPIFYTGVRPKLYSAWMDLLTMDMPPVVLIRGNNQPATTFDS